MKILVVGDLHPILFEVFGDQKWEVHHQEKEDYNLVLSQIEKYQGLIVRGLWVDDQLINAATKLKYIGRAGSGLDNIDLDSTEKKGIQVFNSPEGNADAVAEHCVSVLISLLKNISKSNQEIKNGTWLRKENTGEELSAQTVAIIGYGNTGQAFANKLSCFGCKVLAHDKYKKNFGTKTVKEASLQQIFKQATVVSLHLPHNFETDNYFNEKFYSQFMQPFWFINPSRGKVAYLKHIANALKSEYLRGAAIDVFENEPLFQEKIKKNSAMKYLLNNNKTILTPHVAGVTNQSYFKTANCLARKFVKAIVDNQVKNI